MENRPQPCCSGYQRTSSVMTSPSSLNWGEQTRWAFNDPTDVRTRRLSVEWLKSISELSSCLWMAPESEETLVVCASRRFRICTDALQLSADIWCFEVLNTWTCGPDDTSEHHQLCHLHVALGHFVIFIFFDELCSQSAKNQMSAEH